MLPHFRPDQIRRREGGLAREPKQCTCRYGNLLTSALELSLTGRRISTQRGHATRFKHKQEETEQRESPSDARSSQRLIRVGGGRGQ